MVTDAQVKRLRKKLMEAKTLEAASLAAGMSVRTARTWKTGALPSQTKEARDWRTRPDPFAGVWESDVVPLLEADEKGVLEAKTVIDVLAEKHDGKYGPSQTRTLQRRMREWRALQGPPKEIYFEQRHEPGQQGSFDFTHGAELCVTILGQAFKHLIFEFVLAFSGWTWVMLAFGETFEALVLGLQGAFWELGGVPDELRHDNLSAATHELARTGGRALNQRFADVLAHYGTRSSRISPGKGNENGVSEKAHHLLKTLVEQALIVRGSCDFVSADAYLAFVRGLVEKHRNAPIAEALTVERPHLRPLPRSAIPSYTTHNATVRCWSTVSVGKRLYSVPSRLRGHEVEVRQHADTIEIRYADRVVETMPRLRGEDVHRIDYRHIIWSLVRKPGAFAQYRFREDLFPSLLFRRAYDALRERRGDRADVEYVRILHLAASTMESTVERALADLLDRGEPFDYVAVKALASPETPAMPTVAIGAPDLAGFDELLTTSLVAACAGAR